MTQRTHNSSDLRITTMCCLLDLVLIVFCLRFFVILKGPAINFGGSCELDIRNNVVI